MPSKVTILSKGTLEKMHTGSLMSRRRQLLACEESFENSDRFEVEEEPNPEKTGVIEFKNTKEWENAYKELKHVLSSRENYDK